MLTVSNQEHFCKLSYMELKDRVKSARKAANLTQDQLALKIGISRPAIAQWENGEVQSIDGANVIRAARELGVDALWLATGEGSAYGVKDGPYPIPTELVDAWQRLDAKLRQYLTAVIIALAEKHQK